jgi:hypothetical protein
MWTAQEYHDKGAAFILQRGDYGSHEGALPAGDASAGYHSSSSFWPDMNAFDSLLNLAQIQPH